MPSHTDIARKPHEERDRKLDNAGTEEDRATRFDGNPNPVATDNDVLKPRDDTPFILEKREDKRR